MKRLFKPLADMGDDSIIHIIHNEQDRLEAISDYGYDDLIPLTSADMWQFMPWEGIDKPVPASNKFLVMTRNREIVTAYLSKHGAIRREHSGGEILIKDCLMWVSLPGDL